MKNLLFIAPDSLPPGISRAYWLANGLSDYCNVYYIQWEDSRKYNWQKNSTGSFFGNRYLVSLRAFLKSLMPNLTFQQEKSFGAANLYNVYLPFMIKGPLSHVIGELKARQIARKFNFLAIKKLMRRIDFSYIFHGDGMMYAPLLSDKIPAFCDIQDDFDEDTQPSFLLEPERVYLSYNASKCAKCYAITQHVAEHMKNFTGVDFEALPNGADFSKFSDKTQTEAQAKRLEMGIADKRIVCYIGSALHFDHGFTARLAKEALHRMPELRFVLVGNLPVIDLPNVMNVGLVDPGQVHIFYGMADIGIMPQKCDNLFIGNCHPLKVIQFSAAEKPVITGPLSSFIDGKYKNVLTVEYSVENWLKAIARLETFSWNQQLTAQWSEFSWQKIAEKLANDLTNSASLPF